MSGVAGGLLQQEARALGDPTRHRLFRYIAQSASPVGVAELTALVQLNHNAVRQHLGVLKDAHLIREEREVRDRPGRPRLLYRLHPEVSERWDEAGPYAWLARLLASAIRRRLEPRDAGRQEGHRQAAEFPSPCEPVVALSAELTRRGFRPTMRDRGHTLEVVLGRCPFAQVAAADPVTVCQLHLGLAEGLTEGLGGLSVERLVTKDPHEAGCRLVVRRHAVDSDPN